jgi:hypothetical protein
LVNDQWGADHVKARYVVGKTRKGEAIVVAPRLQQPVTSKVLRKMYEEARGMGLQGKLHVYGTTTTVSEGKTFRFTQVDSRSCKVFW